MQQQRDMGGTKIIFHLMVGRKIVAFSEKPLQRNIYQKIFQNLDTEKIYMLTLTIWNNVEGFKKGTSVIELLDKDLAYYIFTITTQLKLKAAFCRVAPIIHLHDLAYFENIS